VFAPHGRFISFYEPLRRLAEQGLRNLKESFGCDREDIFPVTYRVGGKLVTPEVSGTIVGIGFRENGVEQYL
jgi:hypothetical protein